MADKYLYNATLLSCAVWSFFCFVFGIRFLCLTWFYLRRTWVLIRGTRRHLPPEYFWISICVWPWLALSQWSHYAVCRNKKDRASLDWLSSVRDCEIWIFNIASGYLLHSFMHIKYQCFQYSIQELKTVTIQLSSGITLKFGGILVCVSVCGSEEDTCRAKTCGLEWFGKQKFWTAIQTQVRLWQLPEAQIWGISIHWPDSSWQTSFAFYSL